MNSSKKMNAPKLEESLFSVNRLLSNEWHPTKNGKLTTKDVYSNSNKKVWWLCKASHEWLASVSSRNSGNGCPQCNKELQTPFPEQVIFFYLNKIFSDAINRYVSNKYELDIYIPSLNLGIEYDGYRYHNEKTLHKELRKDEYFSKLNIKVIRIKEQKDLGDNIVQNGLIYYYSPISNYRFLDNIITRLIKDICIDYGIKYTISISKSTDTPEILSSYLSRMRDNSIMTNKLLASEWDYKLNKNLNPWYVSIKSGKKIWWKCKNGHNWLATVYSREKNNCPYCSNQKVLSGYNDLKTKYPLLSTEWHSIKNGNLKPENVSCGSNEKVWWLCEKGHEWYASIHPRTKGVNCPYCSNQKVLKNFNDLESKYPILALEWHPTKNEELLPSMVTYGLGKKVWWLCKKGHEWEASIKHRKNGSGCPFCYEIEPKITTNKRINAYFVEDKSFYMSFNDAKQLCNHLGIEYKKQFGNIASVCRRKQKTLLKKYILRYLDDDEFQKN